MQKILVTIPVKDRHKALLNETAAGLSATVTYKGAAFVTAEDIKAADAVIGALPTELLTGCPQLKWVQLSSAGAAEYTKPGVLPDTCVLTNAAGAYGTAVSEHMLALTFALIRRFGQYGRNQVAHEWKHMGKIISVEDAVVLILGLGDIGGSYARKVKALGAYTIGLKRSAGEKPAYLDEQYTIDRLDEMLPRADIVAMVLPGLPDTTHIMNEARLRLMKKGAYLINVGRGNAIDPDALKSALISGQLGGAGLDVTEPEPLPADDPLWDFGNVIITPHAAGWFYLEKTLDNIVAIANENLRAYLTGGTFVHVVDKKMGY